MRATLLAAAALAAAPPAVAQLANHAISLETALSAPLGSRGGASAGLAIAASRWLDGFARGDLEGVLRVALASAGETGGRGAAVAATAGLRLSLGRAPLRPQLLADLGWARTGGDRVAWGLSAGLEWFPATDVSLAARAALRGAGAALAAEGALGISAYF